MTDEEFIKSIKQAKKDRLIHNEKRKALAQERDELAKRLNSVENAINELKSPYWVDPYRIIISDYLGEEAYPMPKERGK